MRIIARKLNFLYENLFITELYDKFHNNKISMLFTRNKTRLKGPFFIKQFLHLYLCNSELFQIFSCHRGNSARSMFIGIHWFDIHHVFARILLHSGAQIYVTKLKGDKIFIQ